MTNNNTVHTRTHALKPTVSLDGLFMYFALFVFCFCFGDDWFSEFNDSIAIVCLLLLLSCFSLVFKFSEADSADRY